MKLWKLYLFSFNFGIFRIWYNFWDFHQNFEIFTNFYQFPFLISILIFSRQFRKFDFCYQFLEEVKFGGNFFFFNFCEFSRIRSDTQFYNSGRTLAAYQTRTRGIFLSVLFLMEKFLAKLVNKVLIEKFAKVWETVPLLIIFRARSHWRHPRPVVSTLSVQ